MKLTVDQVMSYGPCCEQDEIEALFAGRETITLHDVAAMNISEADKIWLFCQEDVLTTDIEAKWRGTIVTRAIKTALTVYTEPSYVKWAENWLNGIDRSFNSAHAAAYDSDHAAAYAAAHAAAYAAAARAARAARATADAADDEYKQQVADLMELLDKED